MCGFVAILRAEGLADHERGSTLLKMRDSLRHRGPDDATSAILDDWIAIGHRRLSIIDLEGSRQPLSNEDGSVVAVFNGEIYNFKEIRGRLRALGHVFRTDGDGEVLVHGYEEWGDSVAAMIEGMFAFMIADRNRQRVIAGRDRLGIKPLFWSTVGGATLISSEIKGILQHPGVGRVAERTALTIGRVRHHVPWPLTAFHGIFRLPPGVLLELKRGEMSKLRRFAWMVNREPQRTAAEIDDLVLEARTALETAIRRQLIADVPVGAFLSGGIDSTLIVALMARISSRPIHTFSIRNVRDDESPIAQRTANRLGTQHHTVDLEELSPHSLQRIPSLFDEPFAETSVIGVELLSRVARQDVKVVLSGDGGDEVFAGYDSYRIAETATRATGLLPQRAATRVRTIGEQLLRFPWPRVVRQGLRVMALSGRDAAAAHRELSSLNWATEHYCVDVSFALTARVDAVATQPGQEKSLIRQAMAADRVERLADAMLPKVDMASMAASLEVRVPMLDDALVRFAATLPDRAMVSGRWGKIVLRRVLDMVFPGGTAWLKKRGFGLPLDAWMRAAHNRTAFDGLFERAQPLLSRLEHPDVLSKWRTFSSHPSRLRMSDGAAAKDLLWSASVFLWAEEHGVSETRQHDLDDLPVA